MCGDRNNQLYTKAKAFFAEGHNRDEIYAQIDRLNSSFLCPLPDVEVRKIAELNLREKT